MQSSVERKCLSLLQTNINTKKSLFEIHAFMLRNAVETNVNIFTKLIKSSISAGCISYARQLFDQRPQRDDAYLCNAMIISHLGMRQFDECLSLYRELRRKTCFVPDSFTFVTLTKCCSLKMDTWGGLVVHSDAVRHGLCLDLYVSTALVDMYAKFRRMDCARKVFNAMPERSNVSWTALICGYVWSGDINEARRLFDDMPEGKDIVAYNAMIDGYAKLGDMVSGRSLFDVMPERNVISWTSIINGYCDASDIESARLLFDLMPKKNSYSWNVMIGGYCKNKMPGEAMKLFREMQSSTSLEPNDVTILSILPAIADSGTLELGRWVHQYARRKRLDKSTKVCTALVDMYAKCGEIEKARKVFCEMSEKEVASWNALINGYALNGYTKEALEVFAEMQKEGMRPNDITMMVVLSACNHGGLIEEGKKWFEAMEKEFGLTPKIQHYGCLADLLGRAGIVGAAEKLIENMPYEANDIILSSFLSACGYSKDLTRAERVLKHAVTKEPQSDGNYVILRNLYAAEKKWEEADEVKRLMRTNGVTKKVGCSVIEVESRVSEFIAGDTLHPQLENIKYVLQHLRLHMKGSDLSLGHS